MTYGKALEVLIEIARNEDINIVELLSIVLDVTS